MDAAGEATEHVDLKFAKDSFQDLLPDDEEFVVRTRAGGVIQYKNVGLCLSAYLSGDVGLHTGDSNSPSHRLSSIYLSSDGQYELF